jgi:putative (di)nucleoside polyphosphate hydrolase
MAPRAKRANDMTSDFLSDDQIDDLPYRPCVGMMILDPTRRIFAGQRINGFPDAWQMPQGGIDKGETPRQAVLRELTEETGISASQVEILRECPEWIPYELPRHLVRKLWNGRYRGQKQLWFAIRFHGTDWDVNIQTAEPEFSNWSWMAHDELVTRIVPFKRDTYARVFTEFADLL